MLELICFSYAIAIISVVYIKILAFEDVLNWWFKIGLKFEKKWFYKPIWGCQLCFSGQVAFWIYILNWIHSKTNIINFLFVVIPEYKLTEFSVFWLVFSVSISIFITFLIAKIYDYISNNIK